MGNEVFANKLRKVRRSRGFAKVPGDKCDDRICARDASLLFFFSCQKGFFAKMKRKKTLHSNPNGEQIDFLLFLVS